MYYFMVLMGFFASVAMIFVIIVAVMALLDKEYAIIGPCIFIALVLSCLVYIGYDTQLDGPWLTQTREVPIIHIERIDGTTFVYSKFAVVKDTSAKIYICETNKLSLVETYKITEKTKREFPDSSVSLKIK